LAWQLHDKFVVLKGMEDGHRGDMKRFEEASASGWLSPIGDSPARGCLRTVVRRNLALKLFKISSLTIELHPLERVSQLLSFGVGVFGVALEVGMTAHLHT
jgi:hypothetical protein